jgi:predicted small lipoprotein YifL
MESFAVNRSGIRKIFMMATVTLCVALALAGCGRKAGLDAPPSASVAGTQAAPTSSLGDTPPGTLVPGLSEERQSVPPPQSQPARKRIPLDPLLD